MNNFWSNFKKEENKLYAMIGLKNTQANTKSNLEDLM